jgi:hypothetical protein
MLGLLQHWGPITLFENLWLRCNLKKSYSPCWELSNDMSHATYMQGNWGDSWLLMVRSQIDKLTPNFSFGHNLCFRCPNGSCEPISDIYFWRAFQWYKERFNPMNFDLCNCPLKIWESIGIPTPKMGVHLGVWGFIPSHFFALPRTWNVTPGLSLGPHLCKPLSWSRAQG